MIVKSYMRRLFTLLALLSIVSPCTADNQLKVVATTTVMKSLVQEIGGSKVAADVIIPGGSCPGHYDIRPGDVNALRLSSALFIHGYESFVPHLLDASGRGNTKVITVAVKGNWLLPANSICAAGMIADSLIGLDPAHKAEYSRRFHLFREKAKRMKGLVAKYTVRGIPVICSDQQSSLLKLMGFVVVGTYGREEDLTPIVLHKLSQVAKRQRIRMVVDNLQSGPRIGVQLAESIGVTHVILSNFPGGFSKTDTWESCLRDDIERIVDGLRNSNGRPDSSR